MKHDYGNVVQIGNAFYFIQKQQVSSQIAQWETLLRDLKYWVKYAKIGLLLSNAIKYNAFPISTTFP